MSIQARNGAGQLVTIATIDDLLAVVATQEGQADIVGALNALGSSVGAPIVGQIATSASPVPLSNHPLKNGVVVKAKPTNVSNIFVGGAGVSVTDDGSGTGYPLAPGEAISLACANTNQIYVVSTGSAVLYFAGN